MAVNREIFPEPMMSTAHLAKTNRKNPGILGQNNPVKSFLICAWQHSSFDFWIQYSMYCYGI